MPIGRKGLLLFAGAALAVAAGLYLATYLLLEMNAYAAWLVAVNGATFALFGLDKLFAVRRAVRAPEIVLYGAILIGGFLGGWAGMFLFRHKLRKVLFWAALVISTVLHIDLLFRILG